MKATLAALGVTAVFALVVWHHVRAADGNPSAVLHVSARAFDNNPLLKGRTAIRETLVFDGGYDAQFTYFAAFDPWLTRYAHAPNNYVLMMDMAAYRYGRIGHVWLTRLFAGARWRSYPLTMVLLVLAGGTIAAIGLSISAVHAGRSPWWGVAALAIPGFWQSVQLALPEPLAAACVLMGFVCWQRQRWAAAGLCLALALLTRETSAIAALALCAATWWSGHRRAAAMMLAIASTPFLLWRWHIGTVLSPVFGLDAWQFSPGTLDWPLAGMALALQRIRDGTYHVAAPQIAQGALAFGALLCAAAALAIWTAWRIRSVPAGIAATYGVLALCLSGVTVWNHVGNAQRVTFEVFLWLSVSAATWPDAEARTRRLIIGVLAAAVAYALLGAHDATTIRAALGWR